MLNTVSTALDSYYKCFQDILKYTKSQHCLGVRGLQYDSPSRLQLADSILKRKKVEDYQ